MRDKNFDKLLQEKLKGHEYANSGPDWSRMESAMNEADKDLSVDSEIRNRLKHHEVTYQPSHWELLKERLEFEKKLKERIIFSKLAETVILILLVMSVLQFTEFKNLQKKAPSQDFAAEETSNSQNDELTLDNHIVAVAAAGNFNNPATIAASHHIPTSQHETFGALVFTQTSTNTERTVATKFSDDSQSRAIEFTSIQISNRFESKNSSDVVEKTPSEFLRNGDGIIKNESNGDNGQTNKSAIEALSADSKPTASITPLLPKTDVRLDEKASPIDKHITLSSLETTATTVAAPVIVSNLFEKERWIGFSSGVDINTINAPISFSLITEPQNFLITNVSSGFNYGIKRGANEFTTGINYSVKSYDPNFIEEVEVPEEILVDETQVFSETVDVNSEIIDETQVISETIEGNSSFYDRQHTLEKYAIVSLPGQYRRHFNHTAKLHTYAFAGLAANLVIRTEFAQTDQLTKGLPRPKFERDEAAKFQSSDFSPGFFDGGHYTDNLYFTAIGGIGIERQVSKFKVFAEGQYQRNVFASILGPRNVTLNSVSIYAGVKYRI